MANGKSSSAMEEKQDTMLLKLYSIGVILFDMMVMFSKCFYTFMFSIYYTIVPRPEKPVIGEIVLITGTGHGIGKELAIKYASLGATVVCVDINTKGNDETVTVIKDLGFKKVHSYTCDVSVKEDVKELIEKVSKEVGDVTVLVNNAGIMPCHEFLDTSDEEIEKIFTINVLAHFWLLKAVLPSMIKNNHGHVVALSSMAGIVGIPNLVPYCGSKFAVRGYMEALTEELRLSGKGQNIHFTCIYPYIVDTGLCKKPKIRFPTLMNMVTPQEAASMIVSAMRRNVLTMSLPTFYLKINDILRVYPPEVTRHLKDFLDAGVDAD